MSTKILAIKVAPMSLGQRIRAARKAAGLSQVRLSEIIGTTSQAVNQWESDKSQPSRSNLLKVAEALDVSVSVLLQPHILPEQIINGTFKTVRGVVPGGRVVPLINAAQVCVADKFSAQKSIITCSFKCSAESFALELMDNAQEPDIPHGSIIIFDPTKRHQPGCFVVATHNGKTIMGILSCTVPGDPLSKIITPLNPHWPAWKASAEHPITVYGVKTEVHLAG